MNHAKCEDITKPATEIEIAEALRWAAAADGLIIRKLAFERDRLKANLEPAGVSTSMARITAEDLFILCRRASYALSKDRPEDAKEILVHAVRIGKRIGIEDKIIRTCS